MRYPEQLIVPMRQDLTQYGVKEARTAEEVDRLLAPGSGTVLMITNSVCGCAAGKGAPRRGLGAATIRTGRIRRPAFLPARI